MERSLRSIGRNGAREYCTPSLNNSSTIYQETLVRGQPWIAFAREKLWVATYCFFRARFNDASFIQKSGIFFILLMHNVEKVARFNYSATPGIIHLIIMEWNVRLHQILSRIICRNSGLISNRGKGQSGYTPSHIRSRRSRVALIPADSIRHWYEKEKKKRKEKTKIKKKKTGALSFVFRPGLLLTRTRGLKWKIGTKGMVDRARGRVSKIRESLEFVCRARPIQCTRLVTSTSFWRPPRNNEASEQKCGGLLVHLS